MVLDPHDIGMCPAILLTDPLNCDADTLERVTRASAAAGFDALSVWAFYATACGTDRARDLLAELGVAVRVVEAVTQWVDGAGEHLDADAKATLDVASALGADTLLACTLEPTVASMDRTVEGFAAVCGLAADRGMRVCIEFLPWSAIPDLATAWSIVDGSGASNGGIVVDMLHWQRQPGGPNLELLSRIPGDRIHFVQVCDASPAPSASPAPDDLMHEALTARVLPGAGTVDIAALFATLDRIGADPFFAYEVFSSALAANGPDEMARGLRSAMPVS